MGVRCIEDVKRIRIDTWMVGRTRVYIKDVSIHHGPQQKTCCASCERNNIHVAKVPSTTTPMLQKRGDIKKICNKMHIAKKCNKTFVTKKCHKTFVAKKNICNTNLVANFFATRLVLQKETCNTPSVSEMRTTLSHEIRQLL